MTPFLSGILEDTGWEGLFSFAKKQSLLAVIWDDVQDSYELYGGIPVQILKQWVTMVGKIEDRNKLTDEVATRVSKRFAQDGFSSLILKGQGLCHYYPDALHRQSGDIDIWVWKTEGDTSLSYRRKNIVRYIRGIKPDTKACYHHIEFNRIQEIDVEVHFTPTWMYSPHCNRLLQKYFQSIITDYSSPITGQLPLPTDQFNLIFLMIHIYRHVFDEGIGLRQMMDYDLVLRHSNAGDRSAAIDMLNRLEVGKFVGAVMYVLHKVFNTPESVFLCNQNEKEGEWLFRQIMDGGNFGRYKSKEGRGTNDGHSTHFHNFMNRIRRSGQLLFHYPEESLCAIPWRIWHWIWRSTINV